jgi:hypothetical protein
MRIYLHRLRGAKTVTERVLKQSVKVAFIKGMDVRLTTSDPTVLADYRMYQLAWLVSTRIGLDNLLIR